MKTKEIVTTDLSEFGWKQKVVLKDLLTLVIEKGLPEGFYEEDVTFMFNKESGYVFLTNSEHQVCMLNDNKLDIWEYCSNCGCEGFDVIKHRDKEGCDWCTA